MGTKNNNGFTLLEVIISVAALSVMSVFVLQMFMSSATLNARARDADIAMTVAMQEIENLKTYSSLSEYLADDSDTLTVSLYYDKDWNLMAGEAPADAKYCSKMDLNPDERASQDGGVQRGTLYTVAVDVAELSAGENGRTLASIRTKKYFPKTQ